MAASAAVDVKLMPIIDARQPPLRPARYSVCPVGRPSNIWLPSFSPVIQRLHCRRPGRRRRRIRQFSTHIQSKGISLPRATIIIQSPFLPSSLPPSPRAPSAACLPARAQDAICLSVKQRTRTVVRSAASVASSSSIYRQALNYTRMKCRSLSLSLSLSPCGNSRWISGYRFVTFRRPSSTEMSELNFSYMYVR